MEQEVSTTKWSLDDLLSEPVDEALEGAFSKLEQVVVEFEAMKELLTNKITWNDFNHVIQKLETVSTQKSILEAYADLSFAADTQSPSILNLRDRVDEVLTDTNNRTLFLEMWFKDLPEETIQNLIRHSGDRRYFLETMVRFRPYILTELEERMINLKDVNGIDAMVNLYEMITSQFTFELEVDGKIESLTLDQLSSYISSPSPEIRKKAYQAKFDVYIKNSPVLSQMYIHRVRDWHTEALELRGYSSPISARNVENDISDEVVNTLLDVCRKNAGLFQKYFEMKAKRLGLEKLRRYDIFAPLSESKKKFDYSTAIKIVMDSYNAFSPDVAKLAQRVFDENHLDSEIRSGKLAGAFCYTAIPKLTPWVMVNYDGSAYDIATLAHELGHAIHFMLSNHNSVLTHQPSLPLAETASVFAEIQLTNQLLKHENDPAVRRDLLVNALDDAYNNVMRQAYFTIFERGAHSMINDNCTLDELTEHYMELLREQFGEAVDISDEFKWEWTAIPHFYRVPFYTYAYSFGQLLVLALYQQYRIEGKPFIPRYLKILSHGGSESPMRVLSEAGLDITSPAFWQGGFDVLENMFNELEKLSS